MCPLSGPGMIICLIVLYGKVFLFSAIGFVGVGFAFLGTKYKKWMPKIKAYVSTKWKQFKDFISKVSKPFKPL